MTQDGDETKARLLAEARDLYLEAGLARFSLREVARRSGVSAAAVYRHFESREALLRAVCETGFEIFYRYLVRSLVGATARDRLLASARQYLRFGLENPRDYRVIFMGGAEDFGGDPTERDRSPAFQFLVDRVRDGMQDGVLAKGRAEDVALFVWVHVHGLTSLRLSGQLASLGSDAEFAKFYDHSVTRMLAGLAT